jgi:hypothetical protein
VTDGTGLQNLTNHALADTTQAGGRDRSGRRRTGHQSHGDWRAVILSEAKDQTAAGTACASAWRIRPVWYQLCRTAWSSRKNCAVSGVSK